MGARTKWGRVEKGFLLLVGLLLHVDVARAEVVPYTLDLIKDDSGAYRVHGMVSGQPLDFLVDSGASRTSIPSSLAARLGVAQCVPEAPSSTANGIVNSCSVAVDLNVGGFRFGAVRVSVLPNMGDYGLLGNDLTQRLKFSQQNGVMTLASDSLDVVPLTVAQSLSPSVVAAQSVDISSGREKKTFLFFLLVFGLLALVYVISRIFRKNNKQTILVARKSKLSPNDSSYMYQVDRSLNTVRITTNSFFDISEPRIDSRLVAACFGDRGKAERLIAYELRRSPGLSRVDACLRAIDRLADDRR